MNKFASLFLLLPLAGCFSVSMSEPSACDTTVIGTFPVSPVVIKNPPSVSLSVQEDFSDTLNKIGQVANSYSVGVTQLSVNSTDDLSWVSSIQVYLGTTDGSLPYVLFASYTGSVSDSGTVNALNMQVQMDAQTLTSYLKQPIDLQFEVAASQTPVVTTSLDATFCLAVNGTINKSL